MVWISDERRAARLRACGQKADMLAKREEDRIERMVRDAEEALSRIEKPVLRRGRGYGVGNSSHVFRQVSNRSAKGLLSLHRTLVDRLIADGRLKYGNRAKSFVVASEPR